MRFDGSAKKTSLHTSLHLIMRSEVSGDTKERFRLYTLRKYLSRDLLIERANILRVFEFFKLDSYTLNRAPHKKLFYSLDDIHEN